MYQTESDSVPNRKW